jgi:hypothetical protein
METTQGPKTPLQIRLDHAELAALDAYIARFTAFPPSRVDVVRKAVHEWLAQKLVPALHVQAPQRPGVVEASPIPHNPPPLKAAWQPIVALLQQRQHVPARPDEIVTALGWKPQCVAAHLRFMAAAGIVGCQDVGQGKEKRKAYFLTRL